MRALNFWDKLIDWIELNFRTTRKPRVDLSAMIADLEAQLAMSAKNLEDTNRRLRLAAKDISDLRGELLQALKTNASLLEQRTAPATQVVTAPPYESPFRQPTDTPAPSPQVIDQLNQVRQQYIGTAGEPPAATAPYVDPWSNITPLPSQAPLAPAALATPAVPVADTFAFPMEDPSALTNSGYTDSGGGVTSTTGGNWGPVITPEPLPFFDTPGELNR